MKFEDIVNKCLDIHKRKGHDYAEDGDKFSNFKFASELAKHFEDPMDKTFVTMIGIKIARLAALQDKTALNESVEDTRLDLTTYCILWMEFRTEGGFSNQQPQKIT